MPQTTGRVCIKCMSRALQEANCGTVSEGGAWYLHGQPAILVVLCTLAGPLGPGEAGREPEHAVGERSAGPGLWKTLLRVKAS